MSKFSFHQNNDSSFAFVKDKKKELNKKGWTKASQEGFYTSKEWRILRAKKLHDEPFCERCKYKYNKATFATIVNHIQPVTKNPELKLSYSNLESVCDKCHFEITLEDKYNKRQNINKQKSFEDYD